MNTAYPETDAPWTFYFNGEEMPKWSSAWALIPSEWSDDWIGDLCWQVTCRIDHVGNIESEDAELVHLSAAQCLRVLLEKEDIVRQNINERLTEAERADPVYENLFCGLNRVLDLSEGREVCFWTNGYPTDLRRLKDAMQEKYAIYPHRQWRQKEISTETELVARAIRRLASTSRMPKGFRKAILERRPQHRTSD